MKSNKKSKRKTESISSSSSSSSGDSDNSTSSSNDGRIRQSTSHEAKSRKRKVSNSSAKDHKDNHPSVRTSEELDSKTTNWSDYRKHKKSRNDDRSDYHSYSREDDYSKKEKHRREIEPASSKPSSSRKKENDEKSRSASEKHKKYKESNRYDLYDRGRNYKSSGTRETRDDEESRFWSKDGTQSRNQHNDNRRDSRYSRSRRERSRSRSFDHANAEWGKSDQSSVKKDKNKPVDKQKPNFGLSGKLTEETNTYRGVVIKYSEPPEARKPKRRWRLYPFKGEKALQTLYIHRESAYLIGRDRKVVDLPVDHPSCSKQHAALQYRLVPFTRDDGTAGKRVRPYIIDLESANGTFINNKKIEPKKYVELLEKDVIKFGFSSREYVLLHENSKDEAQDDDVKQEEEEVHVKDEPDR